jgi:hypothetical protein
VDYNELSTELLKSRWQKWMQITIQNWIQSESRKYN